MIIEVWVIITGKGDRPYFQGKRPRPELVEKWHREEDGVRVLHLTAKVADAGADPKQCWATVFELTEDYLEPSEHHIDGLDTDPTDSRQLRELRQAIDQHLGWGHADAEEAGDYVARIAELGKRLGLRTTQPAPADPEEPEEPELLFGLDTEEADDV